MIFLDIFYTLLLASFMIEIQSCDLDPKKSQSLLEQFKIIEAKKHNVIGCFSKSLANDWKQITRYIIDNHKEQFKKEIITSLKKDIQRLQQLTKWVIQGQSTCKPIIKWAQNNTHILLTLKLSHRWDSPPCINSLHHDYKIQNNILEYNNECLISNQKIRFSITIPLWHKVMKYTIDVKKDGVGTYYIIVDKQEKQKIWPFLDAEQSSFMVWYQMGQQYPVQFELFKSMRDNMTRKNQKKVKPQKDQTFYQWLKSLFS